ncbi:hypothetical protein [Psychrobacillus sp. BM2]|uniref:hypothetical protein n=1 Tax=Psychrobacillus sp. BM2 TaxID=3400421 RepID=UPI003B02A095
MKKLLVFPLLLLLLLAACKADENDLVFNGTSENWSAQLTISVINGAENNDLELKYMGNDVGTIETFNYYLENTDRGTTFEGNNVSLNKSGIYTNEDMSSNSPSTTNEDTYIISVDWNGNSENMVLNIEEALLNYNTINRIVPL